MEIDSSSDEEDPPIVDEDCGRRWCATLSLDSNNEDVTEETVRSSAPDTAGDTRNRRLRNVVTSGPGAPCPSAPPPSVPVTEMGFFSRAILENREIVTLVNENFLFCVQLSEGSAGKEAITALKDDNSAGVIAVMYSVGNNMKVLFKIAGPPSVNELKRALEEALKAFQEQRNRWIRTMAKQSSDDTRPSTPSVYEDDCDVFDWKEGFIKIFRTSQNLQLHLDFGQQQFKLHEES
ncbi:hypothetical protein ACROYT_G014106 [Oculina patagonica]